MSFPPPNDPYLQPGYRTVVGADPSGLTDSTVAIQKAADAAYLDGSALYIPRGQYLVSNLFYHPVTFWFGDGMPAAPALTPNGGGTFLLQRNGVSGPVIQPYDTSLATTYPTFRDFGIDGNGGGRNPSNGGGLLLVNTNNARLQRVRINRCIQYLVKMDNRSTGSGDCANNMISHCSFTNFNDAMQGVIWFACSNANANSRGGDQTVLSHNYFSASGAGAPTVLFMDKGLNAYAAGGVSSHGNRCVIPLSYTAINSDARYYRGFGDRWEMTGDATNNLSLNFSAAGLGSALHGVEFDSPNEILLTDLMPAPGLRLSDCIGAGTISSHIIAERHAAISSYLLPLAYSANIIPVAAAGGFQTIAVANGNPFTVAAPTFPPDASHTQDLIIEVFNNSGGAMGAITWNAIYLFGGLVWANPASGKRRWVRFTWNGTNWIATGLASGDY